MILVQKLAILILLCSALYFEGSRAYKSKLMCNKKVRVGELFSATCKMIGKRAKWVNICKEENHEEPPKPETNTNQCQSLSALNTHQSTFKKDRSRTQGAIMLSQSLLLSELNQVQQITFFKASLENGNIDVSHCPLNTLIQCNENREVTECIKEGPEKFTQCVQSFCPSCGCALGSLLGFNCETQIMERFILNTTENMEEFGNALETPFNSDSTSKFKYHLYMNYDGALIQEANFNKLKESLSDHYSYWATKYSWTKSQRQSPQEVVDTAKTIIDVADNLVNVVVKIKDVVLGELENEIKQIKLDVDGITQTEQENMEEALKALYTAELHIRKTRALLETLAEETILRVNQMIYYLSKVKDDWEQDKISKFLKFQGKKMTELIERSLNLLKEADTLYTNTATNLITIKVKLESFTKFVQKLSSSKSEDYKKRVHTIRLAVYIPCCVLTLGIGCPVCVGALEAAIKKWESALNSLKSALGQNKEITEKLVVDLDATLDFMQKEMALIIKWQGALITVSEIDYTFPEAEIFGFADVRPAVVSSLENLKTAAVNYLLYKKEAN